MIVLHRIAAGWAAAVSYLIPLGFALSPPSPGDGWTLEYTWESFIPFLVAGPIFVAAVVHAEWFVRGSRRRRAGLALLAMVIAALGSLTGLVLYAPSIALLVIVAVASPSPSLSSPRRGT